MKFLKFFFLLILLTGASLQARASINEGTINSLHNTAILCENDDCSTTSQINFLTTNGTDVHITDSAITGKAWSEKMGWINLNPTHGGITNTENGTLGGYAWGENTGWINLNPTHGGVSINTSGEFTGWAWAQNAGWIQFDCSITDACVTTDWRPISVRPKTTGSMTIIVAPVLPTPIPEQIPQLNPPVDVKPPYIVKKNKIIKKEENNPGNQTIVNPENNTSNSEEKNNSNNSSPSDNIVSSFKNTTKIFASSIQAVAKITNDYITNVLDFICSIIISIFDFVFGLFK